MFKTFSSKIASVINIKAKDTEEIIYFVSYIVIDPGKSTLSKHQIIDQSKGRKLFKKEILNIQKLINEKKILNGPKDKEELEFVNDNINYYLAELKDSSYNYSFEELIEFISNYTHAKIETGAESIQQILKDINIEEEILKIEKAVKNKSTLRETLMKRLAILESFQNSKNKPEWMIINVLPVLPPDLRPIVMLSGDKHSASEINELYRRVIIRNERLKEIIKRKPAKIILNNEKRLLQEAVDSLLDNQRRSKPVLGKDKRVLKSLSDVLKGKTGRFRQNLLGKRVDYSGRSVIVVGPKLKMYECGLPRKMALELYKPFIISKIFQSNDQDIYNPRLIEDIIKKEDDMIWPYLDEAIKERPVLLNRAPTLHRLGVQAFEVKLTRGKAIELHPLTTIAFNADFDGDQMAVHLPLSDLSVAESRTLMIGSRNIIGAKDGKPIARLTQDMVLGLFYLTQVKKQDPEKCSFFNSINEIELALSLKKVHLHDLILLKISDIKEKNFTEDQQNCYLITTPGKALFNKQLNKNQRYYNNAKINPITKKDLITFNLKYKDIAKYVNSFEQINSYLKEFDNEEPFNDSTLNLIFSEIYELYKNHSGKYLDLLKDIGFEYSTKSGITVSSFDIQFIESLNSPDEILKRKEQYIKISEKRVKKINNLFNMGMLTKLESYKEKVTEWTNTKNNVQNYLNDFLNMGKLKDNPIYKIAKSGARGNISNFVQLSGMRGLMVSPKGNIIDVPIKSSFKEGLSMIEFFISTHGARKGMADTALKTADSGYLTRRLVDAAQDIIIVEQECDSKIGFKIIDIKDNKTNSVIVPIKFRLYGRSLYKNLYDKNKKIIAKKGEIVDKKILSEIEKSGINEAWIYTVINCNSINGVCSRCFGFDLSKHEIVSVGTPIGVISAQSIGEPGTQLTMRTFHTGGVAGDKDITQGLPRIKELLDVTAPKGKVAIISETYGKVKKIEEFDNGNKHVIIENKFKNFKGKNEVEIIKYKVYFGDVLRVKINDNVIPGQKITDGSINLKELLSLTDIFTVYNYILKEILRVYTIQGIEISEKYIEIILKKMLSKIKIIYPGDSEFVYGSHIDIIDYKNTNAKLICENKKPAYGVSIILGLKKAPLEGKSVLSAISFQDTVRVLTNSAIRGRTDYLLGIKENIMLGKNIPCGTGLMSENEILIQGEKYFREKY